MSEVTKDEIESKIAMPKFYREPYAPEAMFGRVTLSSFVTPERLPLTESVIKFHYHRAYYQIMTWIREKDGICCELGWSIMMMPLCCK